MEKTTVIILLHSLMYDFLSDKKLLGPLPNFLIINFTLTRVNIKVENITDFILPVGNRNTLYTLKGFVQNTGGHFVSYLFVNNKWYLIDDAKEIKQVSNIRILQIIDISSIFLFEKNEPVVLQIPVLVPVPIPLIRSPNYVFQINTSQNKYSVLSDASVSTNIFQINGNNSEYHVLSNGSVIK